MGLINLQTNLKSLKFGNDRVYGGNSKQPYIQTTIPDQIGEFGFLNQDFILRGGSKAATDSLLDVERLGRYFTDLRNPSGLLFIAKQNLLSRTAVRTQSSTGILNEGVYTPLSTLIEAGGVAFGLHVNKQGLNPFGGIGGINTYSNVIDSSQVDTNNAYRLNRLYQLYDVKILNNPNIYEGNSVSPLTNDILTYSGGPGSILGIGNTNIKFAGSSASQRTGANNPLLKTNKSFFLGKLAKLPSTQYLDKEGQLVNIPPDNIDNIIRFAHASIKWNNSLLSGSNLPLTSTLTSRIIYGSIPPSIISSDVANNSGNLLNINENNTITYSSKQLVSIPEQSTNNGKSFHIGGTGITTPGDFRKLLRNNPGNKTPNIGTIVNSPDYEGSEAKNIEKRVNLGDPGNRTEKNLLSYTNGSGAGRVYGLSGGNASKNSYDQITVLPIYQSSGPSSKLDPENDTTITNDLVKFRIGVIDNDNPSKKTYIHFRAFLNAISDNYTSEWSPTKYVGRGENFYTYNGFDRKVSLSWTVAAQSKAELIPMYKKLNYLASVCTPDYSPSGYMRGNLVTLTIGGYFYEQPGIINGLSYEMNDDNSTWEIGINDEGTYDPTVKELPHMIKVTGFSFTPIHTFVPRKQNINYLDTLSPDNLLLDPNGYGPERYIALKAVNNNYGPSYPWATPNIPKPVVPPPTPTPSPTPSPNPNPTINQVIVPGPLAVPTGRTVATPDSTTPNNKSLTAGFTNGKNISPTALIIPRGVTPQL